MKILHVVQLYHPVKSGAARYFEEIGARLVAEGHHVTVLATDAHDLEHFWMPGRRRVAVAEEMHRGVRIVRLPIQRMPGPPIIYPLLRRIMAELSRLPGSVGLLRQLATLTPRMAGLDAFFAREGPFDLIHAGNITLDFAILPALAYARTMGARFVCTPFVHLGVPGDQSLVRYYTMRHHLALLRDADLVGTMTGLEAAALAKRGVASQQLRTIGVGIDPAAVAGGDAARFRAEQRIQANGQLVLYIGALARDKGAIDTVEAMRRLWASGSQAALALIGAPLAHFEHYYAALPEHERSRIRLLPYAADSVKFDGLAAADMLAMPSRTDSFGIVFLEAWCYGVPVIGAQAGGIPDVISAGQDGLLVRYGDPAGLADAIARLLADPELRQRMGRAGREKVEQQLTWDRVYLRARGLYA